MSLRQKQGGCVTPEARPSPRGTGRPLRFSPSRGLLRFGCSAISDSWRPRGLCPQAPLPMGSSGQEYWSGGLNGTWLARPRIHTQRESPPPHLPEGKGRGRLVFPEEGRACPSSPPAPRSLKEGLDLTETGAAVLNSLSESHYQAELGLNIWLLLRRGVSYMLYWIITQYPA